MKITQRILTNEERRSWRKDGGRLLHGRPTDQLAAERKRPHFSARASNVRSPVRQVCTPLRQMLLDVDRRADRSVSAGAAANVTVEWTEIA